MIKLKPCPFCGGKVSITYSSWNKVFNVWHVDRPCDMTEPMLIDGTKAESLADAYRVWNRRANNDTHVL